MVRSSSVCSPSRAALSPPNSSASSFMCHSSITLSCVSFSSAMPWCDRLWYPSVIRSPSICMTGVATLLSISVTERVESVSNARRTRSYMIRTFSMYCAGLAGQRVKDAPTGVELGDLRVDLLRRPLEEELAEDVRGPLVRRDGDAG